MQTTLAQALVKRPHSVHGRRMRVIRLQYDEKSVIERDDKPQRPVQERMKHLERGTEAIGTFILTNFGHGIQQLTLDLQR